MSNDTLIESIRACSVKGRLKKMVEKNCKNCVHIDPADSSLCCHPTWQCGNFIWSAFLFGADIPNCYDDDLEAPRGWEPNKESERR